MAYVISDDCIACGTCISECPSEAISEGDIYSINPEHVLASVHLRLSLRAISIQSTQTSAQSVAHVLTYVLTRLSAFLKTPHA